MVDVEARDRHLLLMIRQQVGRKEEKHKFLCGHDERDWFVAAVPQGSTVRTAMEALKPQEVQAAQARKGLKARHRNRRHNAAFIRQGEWFFIPEPELVVDKKLVLRNEPLARAGGKPHWAEFLYRSGGETVYVSRDYPQGLTEPEYKATSGPQAQREARALDRHASEPRRVGPGQDSSPGPQDRETQRLAPGVDEYREPGGLQEACRVSRLILSSGPSAS